MIRGLIFDFDGLILDTEVPYVQSWQELFQAHGCRLPASPWSSLIGTSENALDLLDVLESQLGRAVDRAALEARRRERELELIAGQSVLPGVTAYLSEARRLGLKLGLASSSSRQWVSGHLERLGLAGCFDCLRAAGDVPATKPDPALYLAALAALDLNPAEAIALEDSPIGILAAKRAGLFCVAVPNAVTRRLSLEQADLVLDSLEDLPLADLLSLASGERRLDRRPAAPRPARRPARRRAGQA